MSQEISLRFVLALPEALDGMRMATRERRGLSQWLIPIFCVGIIIWGIWLQIAHASGLYFIVLGGGFLLLQQLLHSLILPWMLKRQYYAQSIDKTQQGIDVYPQQLLLVYGNQRQRFGKDEIVRLQKGKLSYLLRMKSGMVMIIPRRVVDDEQVTVAFEQALQQK